METNPPRNSQPDTHRDDGPGSRLLSTFTSPHILILLLGKLLLLVAGSESGTWTGVSSTTRTGARQSAVDVETTCRVVSADDSDGPYDRLIKDA